MTGGTSAASAAPAITAVTAAAGDPVVVLSEDFEDGTPGDWTQSGGPTLSVVEVDGDKALLVAGRTKDFDGIQSPTGVFQPGVEYTFSMRARLAEATAGSAGVRFVMKPAFSWIGSTTMTADAWTTVTGTFTAPAGADPATLQAYIGTADLGGPDAPYDYLVDDILVTAPPTEPVERTVASLTFDDATHGDWAVEGQPTLAYVDVEGGGKALSITRVNDYDGIQSPAGLLEEGVEHTFSLRARLAEGGPETRQVRFVARPGFTWIGDTTINATDWTTVTGTYTPTAAGQQVYIGTENLADAAYTVLIDDVAITATADTGEEPWQPTPDPDFVPGGAVNPTATPLATARGTGDVAALTFDDGPNPGETERLLDILAENDVTATFCVIGQNIQAPGGAEILNRIVDEGHTLCNHTTSYADLRTADHATVEADLTANLAIIREALGDPNHPVPYYRAPNGGWGITGEVAAALGMQPLGLGNLIFDWDDPDNDVTVEGLTQKLRDAIQPRAVVLAHDGGGDRENVVTAVGTVLPEKLAQGFTFTLPQGGIPDAPPAGPVVEADFEDGFDGFIARSGDAPGPTLSLSTAEFHGGAQAALVSDRTSRGDGIGIDLTGRLVPGTLYEVSAAVKMAAGAASDSIWLSMQAGPSTFNTVDQFDGVGSTAWTEVSTTFTALDTEMAFLYFETSFNTGTTGDFLVDDVVVAPFTPDVQDVTPLKDTTAFPVGVAIDERETVGVKGALVTRHFDQITGENHMKPEAWYDAEGTFGIHPQADALMDFAAENGLRVYGHVLVWHSQTPAWFFQGADGTPLTSSDADKAVLRERMRTHIFDVAEALSAEHGLFGSGTNPLVAWDVVNEVVSDSGEFADGLRRSEWYRVLGEEFIDLAFRYADEAFNGQYAVPGSDRPVTLFINDYNTEQGDKQERYLDLVTRLLARDVPIDGVGHQFHVNLAMPVSALEGAIERFADLPVTQVVTELDVTTGTPVTEALLIQQGYYYRDAFRVFREHADELYSVTVWGLTDDRSWRVGNGAPLLFDEGLQAKWAFFGAADEELPAPVQTANVFAGDVALGPDAVTAADWARLPLHTIGSGAETVGRFGLRWAADHLTAYVTVTDDDATATDAVQFTVGDRTYAFGRDGEGDVEGVAAETEGGWSAVVHLPVTATQGSTLQFDVRVVDGHVTTGWNAPGVLGTLRLVEALSYTEAVEAPAAPTIDGEVDAFWADAQPITVDRVIDAGLDPEGDSAEATVRTAWSGTTLHVLAEITDPVLDASGSDPWIQDSFEIFIDPGNTKNGPYLDFHTSQLRINYQDVLSYGTGNAGFQEGRIQHAAKVVPGGYVIEASIELGDEAAGAGTFHGVDFQVNDATAGARTGIKGWADPTGLGYQSSARWGVVQLVDAVAAPEPDPQVTVGDLRVRAGDRLDVDVSGFRPSSTVQLSLERQRGRAVTTVRLGEVTVGADGGATVSVRVPSGTDAGRYTLVAESGDLRAHVVDDVRVTPAPSRTPWAWASGLLDLLRALRR